jgi:hypothetical protein
VAVRSVQGVDGPRCLDPSPGRKAPAAARPADLCDSERAVRDRVAANRARGNAAPRASSARYADPALRALQGPIGLEDCRSRAAAFRREVLTAPGSLGRTVQSFKIRQKIPATTVSTA